MNLIAVLPKSLTRQTIPVVLTCNSAAHGAFSLIIRAHSSFHSDENQPQ